MEPIFCLVIVYTCLFFLFSFVALNIRSLARSLACLFLIENQFYKVVFTQPSVEVKVCLGADRLELFLTHALSELSESRVQFFLSQEATPIPVENLESLSKLHLKDFFKD